METILIVIIIILAIALLVCINKMNYWKKAHGRTVRMWAAANKISDEVSRKLDGR